MELRKFDKNCLVTKYNALISISVKEEFLDYQRFIVNLVYFLFFCKQNDVISKSCKLMHNSRIDLLAILKMNVDRTIFHCNL